MSVLATNLLHGLVSLLWIGGLRRLPPKLTPDLWVRLLSAAVVVSPVVIVLHALDLSPALPEVLRVAVWAESAESSPLVAFLLLAVVVVTVVLFVQQELRPVLASWVRRQHVHRTVDPALTGLVHEVLADFQAAGVRLPSGTPLRAARVESPQPMAALQGLVRPTVLISTGLLERLDPRELRAVIAHEAAHWVQGGNLRVLLVWLFRAAQALSPFALVLFRTLSEAREVAADSLAAAVTGRPEMLASALLKLHGAPARLDPSMTAWQRTRVQVLHRAELASTRLRVRALLDHEHALGVPSWVSWTLAGQLGGLLWLVG